jgi:hypothetical protein
MSDASIEASKKLNTTAYTIPCSEKNLQLIIGRTNSKHPRNKMIYSRKEKRQGKRKEYINTQCPQNKRRHAQ